MSSEPTPAPVPPDEAKRARDFERLITWSSALSIAITAGLVASLKQVNPSVVFQFSFLTVIAFLAGGIGTVLFFRLVLHRITGRRRLVVVAAAGIAATLGYFLFGLKEVSPEKRTDVAIGAAIAIAVLSFFGWIWWRLVRFLEADDRRNRDGE